MKTSANLPDLQNDVDDRGVSIDRVGITGYVFPIKVLTRDGGDHLVAANTDLYVSLPDNYKGVNMSRFAECLNLFSAKTLSPSNFIELLDLLKKKMFSVDAYARFEFDYFINKKAPVSNNVAPQAYKCAFTGVKKGDMYDFIIEVNVIAASVCPCSKGMSLSKLSDFYDTDLLIEADEKQLKKGKKAISTTCGLGAHNQRSLIKVKAVVDLVEMVWIEDLITLVENSASAPTYPLLKRPDEKFVTELGYNNAKFSEDILRDVHLSLLNYKSVTDWSIKVENQESIHPYSATCFKHSTNWKY